MSHLFRRRLVIATGVVLVAGVMAAPGAMAEPGGKGAGVERLHDDFNGDGVADAAVGAPRAAVGRWSSAGAVSVLYGGEGGLKPARKQVLTWPKRQGLAAPAEARYGSRLATGDLDRDGYADLVSRLWTGTSDGDKGVTLAVNWGGRQGLSANATIVEPVAGAQEEGAGDFAVGDLTGDGKPDVAVGDVRGGGHVLRGPFKRSGSWSSVESFSTGVRNASNLAVGDVTGDGAGDLVVLGFGPDDPWDQHTVLFAGGPAGLGAPVEIKDAAGAGVGGDSVGVADLDQDGHGDVVVGRADEWSHQDAPAKKGGALFVSYGGPQGQSASRRPVWINQDTAGVPGTAEYHDRMGENLALGDTDGDGHPDIVTGLPGENVTGTVDAGRVLVLKSGPEGVGGAGAKEFGQFTAGIPGSVEAHDAFGDATSLGDFDGDGRASLIAGAPAENENRGALWLLGSDATGVVAKGASTFGAATLGAPAGPSRFSETLTD